MDKYHSNQFLTRLNIYLESVCFSIIYRLEALQRMSNGNDNCFAIIMIVVETINFCLDWKFSNIVMNTSEPLGENIKQCSWWFSSCGIFVYPLTLLSLCCDLIRDDDNENPCSPALSLVSTITKDIPQAVVAIVVACLTTNLSFGVQFLKSLLGIIVPFIRVIKIFYDFEQRKKIFRTASDNYECMKFFEEVFCYILLSCSFVQFIVLLLPSKTTLLWVNDFLEYV